MVYWWTYNLFASTYVYDAIAKDSWDKNKEGLYVEEYETTKTTFGKI